MKGKTKEIRDRVEDTIAQAKEREPKLLDRLLPYIPQNIWVEGTPEDHAENATSTGDSKAYLKLFNY